MGVGGPGQRADGLQRPIVEGFIQDDGLIWKDTDSYALYEDRDAACGSAPPEEFRICCSRNPPPLTPQAPVFSGIAIGGAAVATERSFPGRQSARHLNGSDRFSRCAPNPHPLSPAGLESEWVETGDKIVRYPRLDPGTYRFQAQTVDRMSGAVSAVSEIAFRITPRWWQSGPLRLGLILLISIVVVLVWQWRVHHWWNRSGGWRSRCTTAPKTWSARKPNCNAPEEKMRQYAEHDDLTGLWNHRIVIERLHQEMDRSRRDGVPLSIILADLDHFKNINDTYGHQAGDKVLQEISAIFQRAVRAYDSVGRYGARSSC